MYPHKGVVKSLLKNEKPSSQALLVDKVAEAQIRAGYGMLDPNDNMKVKMWPTPNASDNRDRGNLSDPAIQRRIKLGKQVGLTMAVKENKGGGALNPTWVEWLMGYKAGYTDLKDWAMLSSRKLRKKSEKQS
tara:strand:- start:130 stop:525 length:396 start_codon:yes stop_codon:yes gene_type:complete